MSEIERYEISKEWAHSGIVKAGSYAFISYCMGNELSNQKSREKR